MPGVWLWYSLKIFPFQRWQRNSSCGQFSYSWICSNAFCRNPPIFIFMEFLPSACLSSQIQFAFSPLRHGTSPQGVHLCVSEGYLASLHAQKLHLLCWISRCSDLCVWTGFVVHSVVALWKLPKPWKSKDQQRVHLQESRAEIQPHCSWDGWLTQPPACGHITKQGIFCQWGSTQLLPSCSLWNLHLCQTPTIPDKHTMEICSSKPLSNELWIFMVPTDAASPMLGSAGVRHNTQLGGW